MVAPLIYSICDQAYFDTHADAFRRSSESHGNKVRIDIIGPNDHAEVADKLPPHSSSTFLVMLRFMLLPELLKHHPSILLMDIDSIFNGKVEIEDEYDMGIFFRPWKAPITEKVLCSATYFTDRAIPFLERVSERLLCSTAEWGCDQAAIWKQTIEDEGKYRIKPLGFDFVSYEFGDSLIWTAKGTRKFAKIYLERKQAYEAAA